MRLPPPASEINGILSYKSGKDKYVSPPLVKPVLLTPENGGYEEGIIDELIFTWESEARATGYYIAFGDGEPIICLTNSYTIESPGYGTYNWCVQAFNPTQQSEWSDVWQYELLEQLSPPVLTSPVDMKSTEETDVTFRWGSVENATGYYLFIDDILVETTANTEQLVTGLEINIHTWYVQAFNDRQESLPSSVRTLIITEPVGDLYGYYNLYNPWSPISESWRSAEKNAIALNYIPCVYNYADLLNLSVYTLSFKWSSSRQTLNRNEHSFWCRNGYNGALNIYEEIWWGLGSFSYYIGEYGGNGVSVFWYMNENNDPIILKEDDYFHSFIFCIDNINNVYDLYIDNVKMFAVVGEITGPVLPIISLETDPIYLEYNYTLLSGYTYEELSNLGKLADYRVFSRILLTNEITSISNTETINEISNPLLWYDFNENSTLLMSEAEVFSANDTEKEDIAIFENKIIDKSGNNLSGSIIIQHTDWYRSDSASLLDISDVTNILFNPEVYSQEIETTTPFYMNENTDGFCRNQTIEFENNFLVDYFYNNKIFTKFTIAFFMNFSFHTHSYYYNDLCNGNEINIRLEYDTDPVINKLIVSWESNIFETSIITPHPQIIEDAFIPIIISYDLDNKTVVAWFNGVKETLTLTTPPWVDNKSYFAFDQSSSLHFKEDNDYLYAKHFIFFDGLISDSDATKFGSKNFNTISTPKYCWFRLNEYDPESYYINYSTNVSTSETKPFRYAYDYFNRYNSWIYDYSGNKRYGQVYGENFTTEPNGLGKKFVQTPALLLSNVGDKSYKITNSMTIAWEKFDIAGNIKLELYKNGILHSVIANNLPSVVLPNSYNWTIPTLDVDNDYTIRISDMTDSFEKFSRSFSITLP